MDDVFHIWDGSQLGVSLGGLQMNHATGTTEAIFYAMLDVLVAEEHRSQYRAAHRESGKVFEQDSTDALAEGNYDLTHLDGHSEWASSMAVLTLPT
jgi:hypothetical protein